MPTGQFGCLGGLFGREGGGGLGRGLGGGGGVGGGVRGGPPLLHTQPIKNHHKGEII